MIALGKWAISKKTFDNMEQAQQFLRELNWEELTTIAGIYIDTVIEEHIKKHHTNNN